MKVEVQVGTLERVKSVAADLLSRRGARPVEDPDAPLRSAGLTSLDLVNLVLMIEEACAVEIPEDRITLENMASLSALARLVDAVRAAG